MAKNSKWVTLSQAALISAIIILMAFTPLGYLKIGLIEITFIAIPVAVGAVILGPTYGAIFGAIFGITSFIQCFGFSAFGTILFGINPFFCFIVCIIPRVLMGYLCGLIFKLMQKLTQKNIPQFFAASLSAPLINTVFYMTALMLLFGTADVIQEGMEFYNTSNYLVYVIAAVGLNAAVEAVACTAVSFTVLKALKKFLKLS